MQTLVYCSDFYFLIVTPQMLITTTIVSVQHPASLHTNLSTFVMQLK